MIVSLPVCVASVHVAIWVLLLRFGGWRAVERELEGVRSKYENGKGILGIREQRVSLCFLLFVKIEGEMLRRHGTFTLPT